MAPRTRSNNKSNNDIEASSSEEGNTVPSQSEIEQINSN